MKAKFQTLKTELLTKGLSEKNFDYVYTSVKSGIAKDLIFKNLTSDIRKVEPRFAEEILNKFYNINGGEFKYENNSGYLFSTAYIVVALACALMLYASFNGNFGSLKIIIGCIFGSVVFSFLTIKTLLRSMQGKYRGE